MIGSDRIGEFQLCSQTGTLTGPVKVSCPDKTLHTC